MHTGKHFSPGGSIDAQVPARFLRSFHASNPSSPEGRRLLARAQPPGTDRAKTGASNTQAPQGAKVNSQGRKPLGPVTSELPSPGRATVGIATRALSPHCH